MGVSYYLDKLVDIRNFDATDINSVEMSSVDLIVTSPPYNLQKEYGSKDDLNYEDYLNFSKKWLSNCYEWLKEGGRICLNVPLDTNLGGQRSFGADFTEISKSIGFKYHSTIVWNEGNVSRRTAWGSWLSASASYVIAPVELIIVMYKGDAWKKREKGQNDITKEEFMAWTNGLLTFNGERAKKIGHPAPFPVELPKRCIKLFSYVGDTVLDPFLGSGTTALAAKRVNRKCVGLELNPDFCELAKNRILSDA
jgi:adenine specific DNA methyltransferase (hpaim)